MAITSTYPVLESNQSGNYKDWGAGTAYKHVSGMLMLPLAEPQVNNAPPVAIVFLHQPYRTRTIAFKSAKDFCPPYIPVASGTVNNTFLNGSVFFPFPSIGTGGDSLTWKAEGQYEFVENFAWDLNNGYPLTDIPQNISPMDLDQQANTSPGLNPLPGGDFRTTVGYGEAYAANVFSLGYGMGSKYDDHLHFPSQFLTNSLTDGN